MGKALSKAPQPNRNTRLKNAFGLRFRFRAWQSPLSTRGLSRPWPSAVRPIRLHVLIPSTPKPVGRMFQKEYYLDLGEKLSLTFDGFTVVVNPTW